MNKKVFVLLILLIVFMLSSNGFAINKGGKYITPQWVVAFHGMRIGVSYGIMFTENIELGASLFYYHWTQDEIWVYHSNNMIKLSADILYHLNIIKMKKLDTFAGLNIGPGINFHDVTPGLAATIHNTQFVFHFSPFAGARYYIKKNLAIFGKGFLSYYSFSSKLALAASVGVTLRK